MIARPLLRWLLFGMGLAVFLGVMLWLSLRTLAMEKQQERTAADAQVQERMRLALWRMDALASTLLIRENARPPQHYSAFHSPSELFAVSNAMIPQGEAFQPSPLLGNLPEFVRLHFEVTPGTATLRSPGRVISRRIQRAMFSSVGCSSSVLRCW